MEMETCSLISLCNFFDDRRMLKEEIEPEVQFCVSEAAANSWLMYSWLWLVSSCVALCS